MSQADADWRDRARELADSIVAAGDLRDPRWRTAVESTPRHLFVPEFYEQCPNGDWEVTTKRSPYWLAEVYRDKPLITDLAETSSGHRVTVSSSTKPGLMVRMLEALDVRDGHRVLEIGTGTGYNAALLCHRLGDARVYSVDIGAELVEKAGARLHEIGYRPTLAASDGTTGLPDYAPYDRIVATCSLPAVPWWWAEQLTDGGLVLVDLKRTTHAGNLVVLRKHTDRLEGRFLPKWAGFMAMRHEDAAPEQPATVDESDDITERSHTTLDPLPWTNLIAWMLAQAQLPRGLVFGYRGFDGRGPEWATFTTPDGSACSVAMHPADDGSYEVRQAGPIRLWDTFEHAYREWERIGQPDWTRFGLTVLPDGTHDVWLDDPASEHRWRLCCSYALPAHEV